MHSFAGRASSISLSTKKPFRDLARLANPASFPGLLNSRKSDSSNRPMKTSLKAFIAIVALTLASATPSFAADKEGKTKTITGTGLCAKCSLNR